MEEVPLEPPYALIVAGASLHWMDWDAVLPRFHDILTPNGQVAIVDVRSARPLPWDAELKALIPRYSTNQDYRPYDMLAELERRGLWRQEGHARTEGVRVAQALDAYVASVHSMASFSPERMPPGEADAFDAALRRMVRAHTDGAVEQEVRGAVIWGRPGRP